MVELHGTGDRLQQHRLSGARRRHDQAPLALTQRGHQIHHASRDLAVVVELDADALVGVQRGQAIERDTVA